MAFTESEFILDFGQKYSHTDAALFHTRIIMTPRSAKTLSLMLQELVMRFEESVGAIAERNS